MVYGIVYVTYDMVGGIIVLLTPLRYVVMVYDGLLKIANRSFLFIKLLSFLSLLSLLLSV